MMRILSKTSLCSSLALATAMLVGARPAEAQVAGSVVNDGGATITGGGSSVVLNAPQTTIDWNATGTVTAGVNNFLPAGNSMNFSSASDFAVLNRVTTSGTDLLGLNGNITSSVNGTAGRGRVFFYNPNGIVVGGTALIDVGSLGLTTSPLNGADTSNWFADFGGNAPSLVFNQADAGSQVQIASGARINSNGTDSFIAVVAPKITTSGTIKTDGDVALVAAQGATLSFTGAYDLFSIAVDIGTDVTNPDGQPSVSSLTVDGGSIGRNDTTETGGVGRHAYLVTVPKNDATTLLITGGASLGFDIANGAVAEGNSVVLSAGRDTTGINPPVSGAQVVIDRATVTSEAEIYGSRAVTIAANGGGTTHFTKDVYAESPRYIGVSAFGDILFDGLFSADASSGYSLPGEDAVGGTISISAYNGYTISFGDVYLDAYANGGEAVDYAINGATGTGGNVSLNTGTGHIVAGNLYIDASGYGGAALGDATGGAGTGGTIDIAASQGGSISAGSLYASADGEGGSTIECSSCAISGGTGKGGSVTLRAQDSGSALSFGSTLLTAGGSGGAGDSVGGTGLGGTVDLSLAGLVSADLGGYAQLSAYGEGGQGLNGGIGGNGFGGAATMNLAQAASDQPTLTTGYLSIGADGFGGGADYGSASTSGNGAGGQASATLVGGELHVTDASVTAAGYGGYINDGQSGTATGGTASLNLTNAALTAQQTVRIDAGAYGSSGEGGSAIGNVAQGGTASLSAANSNIVVNQGALSQSNSLWVGATAQGGSGSTGNGGDAHGGSVQATLSGTTLLGGDLVFTADANGGGSATNGGFAQAGNVGVNLLGSTVNASGLALYAQAVGGYGTVSGGDAHGGSVALSLTGSAGQIGGALYALSGANGGAGGSAGADGGAAYAGDATVSLATSGLTIANGYIAAIAYGGDVAGNAAGGYGQGGTATLNLLGGASMTTAYLDIMALGYGGTNGLECADCGTLGGDGQGGVARLYAVGGNNQFNDSGLLQILGSGYGGNGDTGAGDGRGVEASLQLSAGTSLTLHSAYIWSDGLGGEGYLGGAGGDGVGGFARVVASDGGGGSINHTGNASDPFLITAEGFGGNAAAGAAGNAVGGTASLIGDALSFTSNASGLYVSSYALAGTSQSGTGGNATAGYSGATLTNGATASLAQRLTVQSFAEGGSGAVGGTATGGTVQATINGGSSLTSGTALTPADIGILLSAYALGGDGTAGNGGDATATYASLTADNGTISSTAAHISTFAQGGNAQGGSRAGNADAGISDLTATNGGSLSLSGSATIKADALGGTGFAGADGGNAAADAFANLRAVGGSVSIGGALNLNVNRTGGDGRNGGSALATIDYQVPAVGQVSPVAEILSNGGSVTVGGLTTLTANAVGGSGSLGGAGGGAYGGVVSLRAPNSAVAPSAINLGDVTMTATATAGNGGAGTSSDVADGGNGGAGGDALGGLVFVQAMALDGQLTAGNLTLDTTSRAGNGGDGGSGINGGTGGQGGSIVPNWSAGAINISVPSGGNPVGLAQVTNGFVHLGDINATTSATGGNGGWGGYALGGIDGAAGNGGFAQAGDFYIINRGGDLAAGDLTWTFNATGGNAGYNPDESLAAVGGDGSLSELLLINSNRSGQVDQRGTLTLGAVNAEGYSTGGSGLMNGHSYHLSPVPFQTVNADTHIASFNYAAHASDGPALPDIDLTSQILVQNGSVAIDGALSLDLPGTLAVWLENGTLTADTISISAANFVHDANPAPTVFGSVAANALALTTGGDLIIDADLASASPVALQAPGEIVLGNVDVHGGDLVLVAGTGLTTGNLSAANGGIYGFAGLGMSIGGANVGGDLQLDSGVGDLLIGNASYALGDIDLSAGGLIQTANLTATGGISFVGGAVVAGNLFAGADLGGGVGPLALNPGQDIGLWSQSTLTAGNLFATGSVGAAAPGAIQLGSIDAGILVMLLGGSDIATGAITAGSDLYVGDYSLFALGYDPVDESFDPAPVLAVSPVQTGGNVTVAGNIGAGAAVRVAGGGNVAVQGVNAANLVQLRSGGSLSAGAVQAGSDAVLAAAGNLSAGSVSGSDFVYLLANGAINLGSASVLGGQYGVLGIAGYGLFTDASVPTGAFDPIYAQGLIPAYAAGNTTIGSINSSGFDARTGNFTATNVSTLSGYVESEGLITVAGGWNGSDFGLTSKDIAITPAGSIVTGFIEFQSTNAIGAGLGNNPGAAAGSYLLDNAEFARVTADAIDIEVLENASPIDLLIGDLTLAGGAHDYEIGVFDSTGEITAGRLRVTGKISGDLTDNDYLTLEAQTVEVDAVTGGIDFSPASDAVVGTLDIVGQRFHVAEASLLDKLYADPRYAGRDVDLATAPTAPHAETTINVGTINLDLYDPMAVSPPTGPTYTVYVQNTGSAGARSGLLIANADLYGDLAPGSVDMIINGKWVTPSGTLSDAAVRDAFIADPENDLTLFTPASSINGCALTGGSCSVVVPPPPPPSPPPPPPPPPPPTTPPAPAQQAINTLASQFMFLDTSIGDMLSFGSDVADFADIGDVSDISETGGAGGGDDSDDDSGKSEEKGAIEAPQPIINGKPLDPETATDEPVAGSGNPALIGTGSQQEKQ